MRNRTTEATRYSCALTSSLVGRSTQQAEIIPRWPGDCRTDQQLRVLWLSIMATVFVCQGCHNKLPQTVRLQERRSGVLQFGRPESEIEGVTGLLSSEDCARASVPCRSPAVVVCWQSLVFLGLGSIPPVSAFSFTCRVCVCVCVCVCL